MVYDMFDSVKIKNEKDFTEAQQFMCGFAPASDYFVNGVFKEPAQVHKEILQKKKDGLYLTVNERCLFVFAKTFGTCGQKKDLDCALADSLALLDEVTKREPQKPAEIDEKYAKWLNEFAMAQILLGTVYVYFDEYIKASYHLMRGLKTNSIDLNLPYCHFMQHVFSRLLWLYKDWKDYAASGCGFCPDEPMRVAKNDFWKDYFAAEFVKAEYAQHTLIEEIEGDDGEVIISKTGHSCHFGYLNKTDTLSTANRTVDVWDTFLIDKNYNLYTVKFYVEGKFATRLKKSKLAKGFKLIFAPDIKSV